MSRQISAIDIKRLWYTDPKNVEGHLTTAAGVDALIAKAKEIKNVHQDTWSIDETEPSQDGYKNQLTGATYRMGSKTMGDVTFNFTIGRYDFALKAELMGGKATESSWQRARGIVDLKHCLIALTEDDVYCILPYANVNTREANTDGAIGLAVVATMLEPEENTDEGGVTLDPEYWVDATDSEYANKAVGTI